MQLPPLPQESLERVKGGVAAGRWAANCVTVSRWAVDSHAGSAGLTAHPQGLPRETAFINCASMDNNHSANDSNNHYHTSKTSYRQRQPATGDQPPVTPREPPWEVAAKTKQRTVALVIIMVTPSPGEILTNSGHHRWSQVLRSSQPSAEEELLAEGIRNSTVLFQRKATPGSSLLLEGCSALVCRYDWDVSKAITVSRHSPIQILVAIFVLTSPPQNNLKNTNFRPATLTNYGSKLQLLWPMWFFISIQHCPPFKG